MTPQEKELFQALQKDREENAHILEKPSMRGVMMSVVEKYSETAHFIYELIQNADDVKATYVKFELFDDKLVFRHNGTRHFNVTPVENEEEDSKNGKLGDLNSITSIANSAKADEQNTIGKFGVGFKAVFHYTDSPIIYEPKYRFKITRFVVPVEIEGDYDGRSEEETIFVFPFNNEQHPAEEAFKDISTKLRNLLYPTLFLNSLKKISFSDKNGKGEYLKKILESRSFDNNTIGERLKVIQNDGEKLVEKDLWLFSRKEENGLPYSLGFFITDNKSKEEQKAKNDAEYSLVPDGHKVFCFFPTRVRMDFNFLIHAPFLLTESRESVLEYPDYNRDLIRKLAVLCGDSLLYLKEISKNFKKNLITSKVFDVFPEPGDEDEYKYCYEFDTNLPFRFFHSEIKKKFLEELIIPCGNNDFTDYENAYWAYDDVNLPKLFTNIDLQMLIGNQKAKWVFPGIYDPEGHDDIYEVYREIVGHVCSENDLVRRIGNSDFVLSKDLKWLSKFYTHILDTKWAKEQYKKINVFYDENKKACCAFDENMHQCIFLPSPNVSGYTTIHGDLIKLESCKKLLKEYEISQPSLKDEIYNRIIPKFSEDIALDKYKEIFLKIFALYKTSTQEENTDLVNLLGKTKCFKSRDNKYFYSPEDLYWPTEELELYFDNYEKAHFVDFIYYKQIIDKKDDSELHSFMNELSFRKLPKIYEETITRDKIIKDSYYSKLRFPSSTRGTEYNIQKIFGSSNFLKQIVSEKSLEKSICLWNILCDLYTQYWKTSHWRFVGKTFSISKLELIYDYYYRTNYYSNYDSKFLNNLKTQKWLFDDSGKAYSVSEISFNKMAHGYNTSSSAAQDMMKYFGIEKEPDEEEIIEQLSEQTQEKIKAGELYSKYKGKLSLEDIKGILDREIELREKNNVKEDFLLEDENEDALLGEKTSSTEENKNTFIKEIVKRTVDKKRELKEKDGNFVENQIFNDEEPLDYQNTFDFDDYSKKEIDYEKKLKKLKQKTENDLLQIDYINDLQERALNAKKYSYLWFKTLLELETLESAENNSNSREISIAFGNVSLEPGTQRTLILKYPNRYIPQFMEDLSDISLVLHYRNEIKKLTIEVANVQSYTLKVKIKTQEDLSKLKLETVLSSTIDAKNPVFLLEELRKAFNKLNFEDSFDMQKNLNRNLQFIFGPPGTGKTTYLANEIIHAEMAKKDKNNILVLAPTNKAADVLVSKVINTSKDEAYNDWLIRFGSTFDESIENKGIFKDREYNIMEHPKNVVVTTIARFPYDYFIINSKTQKPLKDIEWDLIVIDEASMIPLINIIYVLYKCNSIKTIIAGDPFQIEPITAVKNWKNENIYSLVNLRSFGKPKTSPISYDVKLLDTQYRSVPELGKIYSDLFYDGMLNHKRKIEEKKFILRLPFPTSSINIVNFPVSEYESIYRPKALNKSPYQVYSSLFAYEFVRYLSSELVKKEPDKDISIGIIAPYRAQASLIDKLLGKTKFPEKISISCGTIHGFQGDECDIIIAVFNPPEYLSESNEMFLNKANIINVAISRARDYLFILTPDKKTKNLDKLHMLGKLKGLSRSINHHVEIDSTTIEKYIFGNERYLEENTFSTSHQDVNVYDLPEKKYEIRTDINAVDVQIHKAKVILKNKGK